MASKGNMAAHGASQSVHGCNQVDLDLMSHWYTTELVRPQMSIVDLISARAQSQGNVTAVCAWDGSLTYAELESLTSGVARYLTSRGIRSGQYVPICFQRSRLALIAMLSILKAGAAFSPIDPAQPPARIQEILVALGARSVVTTAEVSSVFATCTEVTTISLSDDHARLYDHLSSSPLQTLPSSDSPAFVMFTSGSTGVPAGVLTQHSAMSAAALSYGPALRLGASTRILQATSLIWLPCTVEILACLIWGGCVCVPSEDERMNDPTAFIRRHQVNTAVMTPSFLSPIEPDEVPSLEVLGLGGESIAQSIVEKWSSKVQLVLCYGSTETNLCIVQELRPGPYRSRGSVVGARAWIVDTNDINTLLPPGMTGELVIQSCAVADEYLDNKEKSLAKFPPRPLWAYLRDDESSRFCATGDLACLHADGSIELKGRKDNTVKIRGQKVDVDQVQCLVEPLVPAPMQIVTIAAPGNDGTLRIVAMLGIRGSRIIEPGQPFDLSPPSDETWAILDALRDHCRRTLPSHLVPTGFVPCDALPLTQAGKVDRQLLHRSMKGLSNRHLANWLQKPSIIHLEADRSAELRKLWAAVLSVEEDGISMDDDFFLLGGDSLRAIRLVARGRRAGLKLSVAGIFERPIFKDMASACEVDATTYSSIEPFSLLPDTSTRLEILEELQSQYNLDPADIEDVYPCSAIQEGLHSLSLISPGQYAARIHIPIHPDTDLPCWKRAWETILKQTTLLRTTILPTSLGPLNVVLRRDLVWSPLAEVQSGKAEIMSSFAIDESPPDCRELIWTVHHALFDSWAVANVLRLVEAAYLNASPPLSIGMNAVIKALGSVDEPAQVSFWSDYLASVPSTHFPDFPQPDYKARPRASYQTSLELDDRLENLPATLATIIRAAWGLVIAKHSNDEVAVFGMTLTGRALEVPDVDCVLGPTICSVPIRIATGSDLSINDFLAEVQRDATSMAPFEHHGLQNIKRISDSARTACDFRTHLTIQPSSYAESLRILGEEVRVDDWTSSSTYPINIECVMTANGLTCNAIYDSLIVDDALMQALVSRFLNMVAKLCRADLALPLTTLSIAAPEDLRHLHDRAMRLPPRLECCIQDVIQQQCFARDNAPAIISWDGELNYSQLDQTSTALAHKILQSPRYTPGTIIPIYMERCLMTSVSMLAVWKAAAAWTLIDTSHPVSWIEKIVTDVDAQLVITSSQWEQALPTTIQRFVVDLSDLQNFRSGNNVCLPTTHHTDVAFVLYTSGSTSVPKGIVHEHGAFMSGLKARLSELRRDNNSRVLQFSSYAFDTAIEDTVSTLVAGGTVFLPSQHEKENDIVAYMKRMAITHVDLTPSFVSALDPDDLPYLRVLTLAGEKVLEVHRDAWASKVALVNAYGPSEIAIASHVTCVQPHADPAVVGHDTGCLSWIVNPHDHDEVLPRGCIGELLLEGPIMSRGYLNNPTGTEKSFIWNPKWLPSHVYGPRRLYKTGDLAKCALDGRVKILGRKDFQVKLRGQRVELSQVEHFVREHLLDARDLIVDVVALPGKTICDSLVVFATFPESLSRQGISAQLTELYNHLRQALPTYMIPVAMVRLREMPLSLAGKLDRRQLKHISDDLPEDDIYYLSDASADAAEFGECTTASELHLQHLFAEVLKVNPGRVNKASNFIHLGGDSISAVRMVACANRKSLELSLTVQKLLECPNLMDLARACEEVKREGSAQAVLPFELLESNSPARELVSGIASHCSVPQAHVQDAYPCTPVQEGILAFSMRNPGTYVSQQVFKVRADIDLMRLIAAWERVVQECPILRTTFVLMSSLPTQVVLDMPVKWHASTDLDAYLVEDRNRSMQLGAPFARYAIVREGSQTSLVWTIHHALYDGWTLSLITDAVVKAYFEESTWRPGCRFNQFVRYLQAPNKEDDAQFWRDYLHDAAQNSVMFPRPNETRAGESYATLDHRMSSLKWSTSGHLPSTLIEAAWSIVVSRHLLADDILFGTVRSGRDVSLAGVHDVVGPTITTAPRRVRLDKQQTTDEFLRRLHLENIRAKSHEHIGLTKLKELSTDADFAAKFSTLLVVHATSEDDPATKLYEDWKFAGDIAMFNPYALMLEFTMSADDTTSVHASFDSTAIDGQQMERMLQQMEHVLNQLCHRDRSIPLSAIEAISEQDQQDILNWNNGGAAIPEHARCVHDVVLDNVGSHPESQAVLSWDGSLSYARLHEFSNILASQMVSSGIEAEEIVPLIFEKSLWTVVAILGVLKAGGAFILLNPSQPVDRLELIVRTTKAKVLVASPKYKDLLRRLGLPVIVPTSDMSLVKLNTDLRTAKDVRPSNLACAVFTSGSTGTPKGILLEHTQIVTSALSHGPAMNLGRGSRVYQFSAHGFDMAIYDICTTLMMGGCICIPSEDERLNDLGGSIRRLEANWAFFTPSTLALLKPVDVPCIKTLAVGGEFVTQEIVDAWVNRVRLFQCSGPAETTTCIAGLMEPTSARNCLGKGVGALCWLVDPGSDDQLAPIGAVSELVISGATVARGYIESTQQNAKSAGFSSHPAWAESLPLSARPTRVFRTGDLVRYDCHGQLEFIGRKDTQVKLRGQRLELDEVEGALRSVLQDWHVAAEVIEPASAGQRQMLAAFIAPSLQVCLSPMSHDGRNFVVEISESIRKIGPDVLYRLSGRLPGYMVPAAFIMLRALPLNSSEKLDRGILKRIGSSCSAADLHTLFADQTNARQAEGPAEMLLRELWADCLSVEPQRITANSHFVQIGGDSVMAMRLVGLAAEKQHSLTVQQVFRHPLLADMAKAMTTSSKPDSIEKPSFTRLDTPEVSKEVAAEVLSSGKLSIEDVENVYPCTALQEECMLQSLQDPGAYTTQEVYKISDNIDLTRFKAACDALYAAADVLRTRIFEGSSGRLIQVVIRQRLNWESGSDLDEYLHRDSLQPIQLGSNLARFGEVHQNDGSYFVWTRHHACYDGISLSLMLQAIEGAYASLSRNEPLITVPTTRFENFVKDVATNAGSSQFWQKVLRSSPSVRFPSLPNTVRTHVAASQRIQISSAAWKASEFTLATRLRATMALLTWKYTGLRDVLFAETVSGRDVPMTGVERLMAPTFATMPVRIAFEASEISVEDFSRQIQDFYLDCLPYQHTGLHNIARLSDDTREACRLSTLLVIQPDTRLSDSEVLTPLDVKSHGAFYIHPLTIECNLEPSNVVVNAHFDQSAIEAATVARALHQFEQILQQISTCDPCTDIRDLVYCSDLDMKDLQAWNAVCPSQSLACIHDMVEMRSYQAPDRPAIKTRNQSITYEALSDMTTRLAGYLVGLGVARGVLVPLCFSKGPMFIVSILAVLKAGGAFVGIDPQHPRSRISKIVSGTGSRVVLTEPRYSDLFETQLAVHITESVLQGLPVRATKLASDVNPSDAACVVSTSGTTGEPKGIVLEHTAICSGMAAQAPALGINENTRMFQFASHAWDAVILEVLTVLAYGGCICVPTDDERVDDLASAVTCLQANCLLLTPTVASLFCPADMPTLDRLILAGEAALETTIDKWRTIPGYLHNIYGPAECSVFCIWNQDQSSAPSPSHIGKSLTAKVWVVDPEHHHTLQPLGCPGELLIEGPVLARGYLNDHDRTVESFILDPRWSQQPHKNESSIARRMYKTGDVVRQHDDGSFEILGRKDTQIKVNGQRLQSGEVETCIMRLLPDVAQVAVDLIRPPTMSGRPDLAAFIVLHAEQREDNCQVLRMTSSLRTAMINLREALRSRVTRFMVPKSFIPMTSLPRASTGKLARKELKEIATSLSATDYETYCLHSSDSHVPQSEMAKQLQQLWGLVLGVEARIIGANDNFFTRGGDSISAMQLATQARRRNILLKVSDIFRCPDLTSMAATCSWDTKDHESRSRQNSQPLTTAVAESLRWPSSRVSEVFPATAYQSHVLALNMSRSRRGFGYFYLDGTGQVDFGRLKAACHRLVHAHEVLRTIFTHHKGSMMQVVLSEAEIPFDVFESHEAPSALSKRACESDLRKDIRFDDTLSKFMLFRQTGSSAHRLVLRMSHAQYDGISIPKIWSSLKQLYEHQPVSASDRLSSYMDEYLRQQSQRSYQYWKKLLRGSNMSSIATSSCPTYANADNTLRTASRTIAIPNHLRFTCATYVKAAWSAVLMERSRTNDVVFMNLVSGRDDLEINAADIVGACVNVIPIRVTREISRTATSLLEQVHEQHLSSMPFELTSWRDIVRNCTDWPVSIQLGSIVQHDSQIMQAASLSLDEAPYQSGSFGSPVEFADFAVHTSVANGSLLLNCTTRNTDIGIETLDEIVASLATKMSYLFSEDDRALAVATVLPNSESGPHPASLRLPPTPSEESAMGDVIDSLSKTFKDMWATALGTSCEIDVATSFFDHGGDLVSATQLALMLQSQGYEVVADDIFAQPGFQEQLHLLLHRRQQPTSILY